MKYILIFMLSFHAYGNTKIEVFNEAGDIIAADYGQNVTAISLDVKAQKKGINIFNPKNKIIITDMAPAEAALLAEKKAVLKKIKDKNANIKDRLEAVIKYLELDI